MPYKYKRRLPYGARATGAAYKRASAYARKSQLLKQFAEGAPVAAQIAQEKLNDKYEGYYTASGQGKYHLGRALKKVAKKAHLGRYAKAAAMDALGVRGAGMYTGRGTYTGHGIYTPESHVQANSLVNNPGLQGVPQFTSTRDETGALSVTHREYITDVYGPTSAFNNQTYALNPGLESTFPFLSQIAQNYEEYEFKQLMFTFRSTTSDIGNSTNGQVGTLIMATRYNAASGPFLSKSVMMEYDGAMSTKVTSDMVHGVECDNSKLSGSHEKYVRTNPVVTNQDLKTYDHGTFQFAVANSPAAFANFPLGEIWVSYNVILRKPKLHSALGFGISRDMFVSHGLGTPSLLLPFGTDVLKAKQNNIGCLLLQYGSTFTSQSNTLGTTESSVPATVTIPQNEVAIVFPAAYTGYIRIIYHMETSGSIKMHDIGNGNVITYGQVTPVADMYFGGDHNNANVTFYRQAPSPYNSTTTITHESSLATVEIHLQVSAAANGCENAVRINMASDNVGSLYKRASIEIEEYNASFTNRVSNLADNYEVQFVNSSGALIVPN